MAAKRPPPAPKPAKKPAPKLGKTKAQAAIELLRTAVQGKDNLMQVIALSDEKVFSRVAWWCSTRSIAVDDAINVPGFPGGRLVSLLGAESSGKTTLVGNLLAQVQALGGVAAIADSERKLDLEYMRKLGVDADALQMIQPVSGNSLEEYIEATRRTVETWIDNGLAGKVPLVVAWDTVAGMSTLDEEDTTELDKKTKIDGTIKELQKAGQPGQAAKKIRAAMRTLIDRVSRAGALWVIVNQQYEQIGGFSPTPGVKRKPYGGKGIPYHSTIVIEMIRTGTLKATNDLAVGIEGLCRVQKNQLAPQQDVEFAIQWGCGFQNAWTLLQKLKEAGYITKSGHGLQFQMQGQEPVAWVGGWQGLSALLVAKPDLYAQMCGIYQHLTKPADLPPSAGA